ERLPPRDLRHLAREAVRRSSAHEPARLMDAFEQRRTSFGSAAGLYDASRPSYPPEAVRWMLGETPLRVVDLGAGTGIFSRLVASLGHDVVAVEPDAGMRARLAEMSPGVPVL